MQRSSILQTFVTLAIGAFVALAACASPLFPGADPDVLLVDGTIWLYATAEDGHARQYFVHSSRDLLDWTRHGPVFDFDDVPWIPTDKKAWAPGVFAKDGRYYLYYSCGPKPSSIGVAVSDSPVGPFIDSGHPLLQDDGKPGFEAIDAHVFEDPATGRVYFYAGGSAGRRLRIFALNDDLVSFAREIPTDTPPRFTEAPFMIETDGRYLISYSHGSYRHASYSVHWAAAPAPTGPWTYEGQLLGSDVRHKGPGHHALLRNPESGDWYIFYHRYNEQAGSGPYRVPRQLAVDRVEWSEDGRMMPVEMTDEPPDFAQPERGLYFVGIRGKADTAWMRSHGVHGPYLGGWRGRADTQQQPGYFGWLTSTHAEALREQTNVACVHRVAPDEVVIQGHQDPASRTVLTVMLAPNGWDTLPDEQLKSFLGVEALSERWHNEFGASATRSIIAEPPDRIRIDVAPGHETTIINHLRHHPQVHYLGWSPTLMRTNGAKTPTH